MHVHVPYFWNQRKDDALEEWSEDRPRKQDGAKRKTSEQWDKRKNLDYKEKYSQWDKAHRADHESAVDSKGTAPGKKWKVKEPAGQDEAEEPKATSGLVRYSQQSGGGGRGGGAAAKQTKDKKAKRQSRDRTVNEANEDRTVFSEAGESSGSETREPRRISSDGRMIGNVILQ